MDPIRIVLLELI